MEKCPTTHCIIDRLPVELLSEIFLSVVYPDKDGFIDYDYDPYYASLLQLPNLNLDEHPWTLIRVCKSWRRVGLTTPALWAVFQICLTSPRYKSQLSILRKCLELSKNAPLSFRCDLTDRGSDRRILAKLLLHAPRWRISCFRNLTTFAYNALLAEDLPRAKKLESLTLLFLSDRDDIAFPIQSFPHIRSLHLFGGNLDPHGLDSRHLQELFLAEMAVAVLDTLQYLKLFPALKKYSVGDLEEFVAPPPLKRRLSHEQLENLEIRGPLECISTVLSYLETKSITTLADLTRDFEFESGSFGFVSDDLMEPYFDYLRRHQSTLRNLSFEDCLTCKYIIEMLRCAPNLEQLRATVHDVTDEDILALTVNSQDRAQILGAELTDLRLFIASYSACTTVTLDRIDDLILSRWRYKPDMKITIWSEENIGYPMDNAEIFRMCRDGAFLEFNRWRSARDIKEDTYLDWYPPNRYIPLRK